MFCCAVIAPCCNGEKLDAAEAYQRGKPMYEREVTPEVLGVLGSMELFKGKDPDDLTEWLGRPPFDGGAECTLREFTAGESMTTEGDFGNTFFVLVRGAV